MWLLKLIPIRDWIYIGVLTASILGVVYWNEHERNIGRDEIRAEAAQQMAVIQKKIADTADAQNIELEAKINAAQYKPLTPFSYNLPTDCGSVPPSVLLQINSSHKTH